VPDIAVVQECAAPPTQSDQCLWFGDNLRQGVLVQSFGSFTVHTLPPVPDVPKYIIPLQVRGPIDFLLFAVWSKANVQYRYVEAVVRAVDLYRHLFTTSLTVLIGDLNSNAIWDDNHPPELNHSALVELLGELGLSSAYHHFFGEAHGEETRPTYYFQWKEQKPYHIDYCFVPSIWAPYIRCVEIGSYAEWQSYSDHRPLLVEVRPD
jgi:hypothetical protein